MNGFTSKEDKAVYEWLSENAGEKVADTLYNYLSITAKQDIYSGLVDDGLIDDEDDCGDGEDEDDEESYALQHEIAEAPADCRIGF